MKYNISASFEWLPGEHKEIEAGSLDEAREKAKLLSEELLKSFNIKMLKVTSGASVSGRNYIYDGIYLIKRYSSWHPARCIRSYRKSGNFEHEFILLATHKKCKLVTKGKIMHPKVGKKLCDTGKISNDCPNDCPARFICFTKK